MTRWHVGARGAVGHTIELECPTNGPSCGHRSICMSVRNADTDQFACLYSIIRSPPGLVNLCNAGVAKICNVTHMQWRNGARVRCCDGTKVQSINKKPSQALKSPGRANPDNNLQNPHNTRQSRPYQPYPTYPPTA